MYRNQEKIREEQRKIIGIEPVIDMKHFVLLLLADLASKTQIIYLNDNKNKIACLSTEYKKIIEDIMYQENGWGIRFATLINIHTYYEFQSDWKKKLGKTIEKVIKELNKEFVYNFENDRIEIEFTKEEINDIKSNYDEETLTIMDHFTNLINDTTFTRNWDLEMNDMNRSVNRGMYESHVFDVIKLRRIGITNPEEFISEFQAIESKHKRH